MIAFILAVFAGFFAIMNPIINTPIFIGLTEGFDSTQKRKIAIKSTLTAFIILLVMVLFGKLIFNLFGLTLPAFRITGGILVFIVGLDLLRGETPKTKTTVKEDKTDQDNQLGIAISPLATPLLAGPGTIVTALNFTAVGSLVEDLVVLGVFSIMCLWTFWMFVSGEKLVRFLGKNAVMVIGRMMGLILATLGIHMLTVGIYGSIVEGIKFVALQQ
jgi:multiple antibiotic resistance protein